MEGNDTIDALMAPLQAYEQKFRPFISQLQESISEGRRIWNMILATAFGVALMKHFMGIASFLRLSLLSNFSADPVKD